MSQQNKESESILGYSSPPNEEACAFSSLSNFKSMGKIRNTHTLYKQRPQRFEQFLGDQ